MNWKEFIEKLLSDFRVTTYELNTKYGLSSSIISLIKTGKTKKPSQHTVKRLEEIFDITIEDLDPNNIYYIKNKPIVLPSYTASEVTLNPFPLVHTLLGIAELKELMNMKEVEVAYFNYPVAAGAMALHIKEDSIRSVVEQGDVVLADMDAPIENGCIVAVLTKRGELSIRRFQRVNPTTFALMGIEEMPRIVQDSEVKSIYRIVRIYKTV